jgi:copper chaperone CopZ
MNARIFKITGMTCESCRNSVENALQKTFPNVLVTLNPPQATFANDVDLDDVRAVLAAYPKYKAENSQALFGSVKNEDIGLKSFFQTYFPLFLIGVYISVASFAGVDGLLVMGWMTNFMAGFFLVFSFFKLLDLRGFADAFAGYDIIARRFSVYGFIYPFLELALGLAFLFRFAPYAANIATFALMGVGSIGVAQAVLSGSKIRCACLGTVLNLPMSTITLVENGLMISMSVLSLVFMYS